MAKLKAVEIGLKSSAIGVRRRAALRVWRGREIDGRSEGGSDSGSVKTKV